MTDVPSPRDDHFSSLLPGSAPTMNTLLSRRGLLMGSTVAVMLALLSAPQSASAAGIVWGHPFSEYRNLNWGYGARDGRMHHGIDYPLAGTARPRIHCVADGSVFDQGWHTNFGNFVEVRHADGWSSYYAHMQQASPLRRADVVHRGDVVGVMGNTGAASFGDHLHVEVRTSPGVWDATTDPQPLIHRALLPHETPPPTLLEEDDMIALKITQGTAVYHAVLGPGIFRGLIAKDDPEKVKNILRIQDDWQTITAGELPIYLRTFGCDLNVWEIRDNNLLVRDPLDGSVQVGNVWTATGEIRAALARL